MYRKEAILARISYYSRLAQFCLNKRSVNSYILEIAKIVNVQKQFHFGSFPSRTSRADVTCDWTAKRETEGGTK